MRDKIETLPASRIFIPPSKVKITVVPVIFLYFDSFTTFFTRFGCSKGRDEGPPSLEKQTFVCFTMV